jgi:hypothetical protein
MPRVEARVETDRNRPPARASERALSQPIPRAQRALIAAGIGILAGVTCYAFLARPGFNSDFYHVWVGIRALAHGSNPYTYTNAPAVSEGHYLQFYPLPALVLLLPLAGLTLPVAGGIFLGVSSGILAYLLTRDGYTGLALFLSAPFVMATSLGQWSPLVVAAALEPRLGFVFAGKPNIGLAAWVYRPTRIAILGSLCLVAVSFLLLPSWPIYWLHNIAGRPEKSAPVATLVGPLFLLAVLRWRKPEARLFLAMCCIPQALFFYDQLLLWLLPRTLRQSLILSLASFVLLLTWFYRMKPGDLYVQKAMPYAIAIYVLALPLLFIPFRNERTVDAGVRTTDTDVATS